MNEPKLADFVDPEVSHFVQVVFADRDQPDAVVAITAAAYIEDYLARELREQMPGLDPDTDGKLFGIRGVLSGLTARIDLAKALDLIDVDWHNDLLLVAKVRNCFAHNVQISFEDPEVVKHCGKLRLIEQTIEGWRRANAAFLAEHPDGGVIEPTTPSARSKFTWTAATLCAGLHYEAVHRFQQRLQALQSEPAP